MSANFDPTDDVSVLEALKQLAHQMRKSQSPEKAITAAKCELLLSKEIEDIRKPASQEDQG